MWFCDAKHVIAVVITDHWACFKDVPGEQFAEALAEAVYFGEADVCSQGASGFQQGICPSSAPSLDMVYTIQSFHIHTGIAVSSFPTKIIFTIILKK